MGRDVCTRPLVTRFEEAGKTERKKTRYPWTISKTCNRYVTSVQRPRVLIPVERDRCVDLRAPIFYSVYVKLTTRMQRQGLSVSLLFLLPIVASALLTSDSVTTFFIHASRSKKETNFKMQNDLRVETKER